MKNMPFDRSSKEFANTKISRRVLIVLLLVIFDQLIKFIVKNHFNYITNKGFFWSYVEVNNLLAIVSSCLLLIALVIISRVKLQLELKKAIPYYLMLSGAIANICDRIFWGGVIDFIHLPILPVLNIADIYITCGIIIIVLKILNDKENLR